MESQQPLKPTFLTLPLEIRLMIYKLLAHQTQNLESHVPWPNFRRLPYIVASSFYYPHTSWPHRWEPCLNRSRRYYPKQIHKPYTDPSKTILTTLRGVNRQLFGETRDLIAFKELSVNITADFEAEGTDGMVGTIAAVLGQEVLRENVVAVALHWTCCKEGWLACRHATICYDPSFPESICRGTIARLWAPASISTLSFHAAITTLEQFPNLKQVHMLFNHGDLAEWFADPVASMGVFEAFLRSGGSVSLKVGYWFRKIWRERLPSEKFERVLERGKGRVVICRTGSSDAGVVLRAL